MTNMQMANAERIGNIRTLDDAHTALATLVDVLRDHDLSPMRHHGLLAAIDLVATALGERADFLREMAEEGASHV